MQVLQMPYIWPDCAVACLPRVAHKVGNGLSVLLGIIQTSSGRAMGNSMGSGKMRTSLHPSGYPGLPGGIQTPLVPALKASGLCKV